MRYETGARARARACARARHTRLRARRRCGRARGPREDAMVREAGVCVGGRGGRARTRHARARARARLEGKGRAPAPHARGAAVAIFGLRVLSRSPGGSWWWWCVCEQGGVGLWGERGRRGRARSGARRRMRRRRRPRAPLVCARRCVLRQRPTKMSASAVGLADPALDSRALPRRRPPPMSAARCPC